MGDVCQLLERGALDKCCYQKSHNPVLSMCNVDCGWLVTKEKIEELDKKDEEDRKIAAEIEKMENERIYHGKS